MSDWLTLKKFLDHCSHEQLAYEMTAHGDWIVIWDDDMDKQMKFKFDDLGKLIGIE